MLGHYHLWLGGVEHNDISVNNLMYDKLHDRGVLNDYDLAHLVGHPRPGGKELTGTIPFMAIDLLTEAAWKGDVTRQYRHDCESFAWVLLWICCRYHEGKEIEKPPLGALNTGDYNQCFLLKYAIFALLSDISPTESYQDYWEAAKELIKPVIDLRILQDQNPQEKEKEELATDVIFKKYADLLAKKGFPGVL